MPKEKQLAKNMENFSATEAKKAHQRLKKDFETTEKILGDPFLLYKLVKEIQKEGVVGEEDTITAILIKFMLRLVIDAHPTSSNFVLSDDSGCGKDNLLKAMGKAIIRKTDYYHRSGLSAEVFTYWNTKKKDFTWNQKIIHIEDIKEEVINCQGFKVMASGGGDKTVVKNQKAEEYHVEGKPIMALTSLNAKMEMEAIRRWDNTRMDTSKELTKAIIKRTLLKEAGKIDDTPNEELRMHMQKLEPKKVIIPYAEELLNYFIYTTTMRTQHHKFLDYIKASAVLHQWQREHTPMGDIIATYDDYRYARFCFIHFQNERGVPLNRAEEELISLLSQHDTPLSIQDILKDFSRGQSWLYENIDRLKSLKLLKEMTIRVQYGNMEKDVTHYYLNPEVSHIDSVSFPVYLQQEKMGGFSSFFENCEKMNEDRKELGLKPLFASAFSENTGKPNNKKNNNKEKIEKNSEMENHRKQGGKQPEHTGNTQTNLDQQEKMQQLKDYIDSEKSLGNKIKQKQLEESFGVGFIQVALNKGVLKYSNEEWWI